MKKYILFDLDGTLTDPAVGITTCVQYALKSFGIEEEDREKLNVFIGPPLKESFMTYYNLSAEDADKAVEKYRERFRDTGIFENELYGGIHDLLRSLQKGGLHLAVASSKPTVFVERILKHFKLDSYFEVVVGSELDGTRVEKHLVIQEVMHRFFPQGQPKYEEAYMVGDRKHDILGARTFHMESVGVSYGYGSVEELKEAKADYIVNSVPELKKLLMREVEELARKSGSGQGAAAPGHSNNVYNPNAKKLMWRLIISLAMFYVLKMVATSLLSGGVQMLAMQMPVLEPLLFIADESGQMTAFNANASLILMALGYVVGALAIWKTAKVAIARTTEKTQLEHLKKEPVRTHIFFAILALGAVLGVNTIQELSGMKQLMEASQTGTAAQAPALWLGLLVYGVTIPMAEELMFRGVGYNCLRRFIKKRLALPLAGIVFCAFSADAENIIYAVVLGILCTYAYDYYGSIWACVVIHVFCAVLGYLIESTALGDSILVSVPVGGVLLFAAVAAAFFLEKEKGLFKRQDILL